MAAKVSIWERITAQVITELENGTAPWRKSWSGPAGLPRNGASGKVYRGVNVMLTAMTAIARGYDDPRWYSFKQANAVAERAARKTGRDTVEKKGVWCYADTGKSCGGIRKGQNAKAGCGGTTVVWWAKINFKAKVEAADESEDDGNGGRSAWVMKPYSVFNAAQLDDHVRKYLGQPEGFTEADHEPDVAAEAVIAKYDHEVRFGGNQPAYSAQHDKVYMPQLGHFDSAGEYYSAYFHELGHQTGHSSRLSRPGVTEIKRRASHAYADEELVAEFTACFLCGHTGVARTETLENSAAYLRSWASKLRESPKIVVYAAQRAQKAADLILGTPAYAEKAAA